MQAWRMPITGQPSSCSNVQPYRVHSCSSTAHRQYRLQHILLCAHIQLLIELG
jgi:hypothetical protein